MEESSSLASSFRSPAADDPVPAAADDPVPVPPTADNSVPSRYPSWVLLDKRAHLAHHESATTKKVRTCTGQEVEISFCVAEPPAVSHFCVHSPQISGEGYTFEPSVVSSDGNLVLLRFAFKTAPRSTDVDPDVVEFFVCKAGSGDNLSIEPVPCSPTGTRLSCHAGIVPRDGGNFLVADLFLPGKDSKNYDLHVFSSETNKWTTTYLQLRTRRTPTLLPQDLPSQLDKVISLKGSVVGWVDLWRGILFCDVLDKEPVLTFTPLPTTAFNLHRKGQAQKVRDVTCCNGIISFVEIEHCLRELNMDNRRSFKTTQNLDTEDSILYKECLVHEDLDNEPELVPDGWKIRTMCKGISWDFWRKRHTVHVDDISAVPENGGAMKCTLRDLKTTGFPFFGVYGNNVVYLMSNMGSDDEDSRIAGVHLDKKKLEVIEPYCPASASCSDLTFLPCAFSEYMNATPRPYAELVAASYSQNGVLNNHLPLGDTIPVASSAQIGVPNSCLPLSDTVPDIVQPQQKKLNVDGYYGSWNASDYGTHSGYGNYQQPTPLQPQHVLPSNFPPTVQPMLPLTRSGYIYAHWTVTESNGMLSISVPLDGMARPIAAPLALPCLPVPWPQLLAPRPAAQVKNRNTDDLDGQNSCCSQPLAATP